MINPIGIFDSGVGGLTVLKEIKKRLPSESIVYLGDNARNPYGSKSAANIRKISQENALFLLQHSVKLIVVACNTASAIALQHIQQSSQIPVVGVIGAGVKAALNATRTKKIGVIGTRQTIASKAHELLIKKIDPTVTVVAKATPLFAPIVEEGLTHNKSTKIMIAEALNGFKDNVDTLILGCTHYPLLREQIQDFLPNVKLIDPAQETAKEIELLLYHRNLFSQVQATSKIYVTDSPHHFMEQGKKILNTNIFAVEKATIDINVGVVI